MNLPARYATRYGIKGLIPFVILTIMSVPLLTRITVDPALGATLPDDDAVLRATREASQHLYETEYVQIVVNAEPLFAPETLRVVRTVTERIADARPNDLVVSATTVRDVRAENGVLQSRQIVPPASSSALSAEETAGTAERAIRGTELFREMLLTPKGNSHIVYVFLDPETDVDRLADDISRVLADVDSDGMTITPFGWPILQGIVANSILHDLRRLGIISLVLIFCIELVAVRRLSVALALWGVSAASAVWSLAAFPVFGIPLSSYTIMVPVTVLALATSYGIHVFRYHTTHTTESMAAAVTSVTPIVLSAAATTIVGFSSLLLARNAHLQSLGLLIGVGVILAAGASLYCLPAIFDRVVAVGSGNLEPSTQLLSGSVNRPWIRVGALTIGIGLAAFGWSFVEPDPSPRDAFDTGSAPGQYADQQYRFFGATELEEVYVDTGTEFGVVDMDTYQGFVDAVDELGSLPHVVDALALPTFVNWINGRLAGLNRPTPPSNEIELGESLELLFSQDTGLGVSAFVDSAYRRLKILLLFDNRTPGAESGVARREEFFAGVDAAIESNLGSMDYVVTGPLALRRRSEEYLAESQVRSGIVFFAFLISLLTLLFRDLRWVLVAILPTVTGIVAYYGILGLGNMDSSFLTVFFVAGLMGVSNDDVLYLTLSLKRSLARDRREVADALARSGGAIVQTTLVIMVGIGTFAFSSFRLLGQGGLVFSAALLMCTAVTLFVVPALVTQIVERPTRRSPRVRGRPD